MSSKTSITERAALAKSASLRLAAAKTEAKNAALTEIAKTLERRQAEILEANQLDLDAAQKAVLTPLEPSVEVRLVADDPFHRLDPSRSKPGSGLGLALVRAIAERHGARVTLSDNAPGLRVVVSFLRTNTISVAL